MTYLGLFHDSKAAGEAIAELKEKGYTKDISVVAKDYTNSNASSHQIKQDVSEGTAAGAVTGAAMGALGGLLIGAASFIVPGVGLVVLGPLAALLAGTATGALTGGILGALVDWGIPNEQAQEFQDRILKGEVLVAITADASKQGSIMEILNRHGASETLATHNT